MPRIGIQGGGLSGCYAAWLFEQLGYTDIVIMESASQLGGKIRSISHEGLTYELGGMVISPINPTIEEHIHSASTQTGQTVPLTPCWIARICGRHNQEGSAFSTLAIIGQKLKELSLPQFVSQMKVAEGFKANALKALGAGFWDCRDLPKEYDLPVSQFAQTLGTTAYEFPTHILMSGLGYGPPAAIAQQYWLMGMCQGNPDALAWEHLTRQVYPSSKIAPGGMQALVHMFAQASGAKIWTETLVKQVDVLEDGGVQVYLGNQETPQRFDHLLITTPQTASQFLTLDQSWTTLLSKLRMYAYRCSLVEILQDYPTSWQYGENIPQACAERMKVASTYEPGEICLIISQYANSIFTIYQIGEAPGDEGFDSRLKEDLAELGISNYRILEARTSFEYFPHFSPEDVSKGLARQLQTINEGESPLVFMGAAMCLDSIAAVMKCTETIIRRKFSRQV